MDKISLPIRTAGHSRWRGFGQAQRNRQVHSAYNASSYHLQSPMIRCHSCRMQSGWFRSSFYTSDRDTSGESDHPRGGSGGHRVAPASIRSASDRSKAGSAACPLRAGPSRSPPNWWPRSWRWPRTCAGTSSSSGSASQSSAGISVRCCRAIWQRWKPDCGRSCRREVRDEPAKAPVRGGCCGRTAGMIPAPPGDGRTSSGARPGAVLLGAIRSWSGRNRRGGFWVGPSHRRIPTQQQLPGG